MYPPRLSWPIAVCVFLLLVLEAAWLLGLASSLFAGLIAILIPILFLLLVAEAKGFIPSDRTFPRSQQEKRADAEKAAARAEAVETRDLNLLRALMDNSPDRIYIKDTDSRFLHISRALASVFDLRAPAEVVGKTDADFFAAEFAQQCRADELAVIHTGKPLLGKEEKETHPDGHVTWAVTTTLPLRDAGGQVIGILGLSRDITEWKRAEHALHQAEEKYRGIFENAVEGIYQTTVRGRFLTANPKLAEVFGFASPAELLACEDMATNHLYVEPDRRTEFMRLMRENGEVTGFESLIRRRDGTLVWISENARTLHGADGTIEGYEGTIVDITARKHGEETLRQANDALRAIIQASPLAIFTIDLDGVVRSWNVAAERMFGWQESEVLGRPTPLVPPEMREEFRDLLDRLRQGEVFAGTPTRRQRKDGTLLDVSLSAAPLYDAGGKVSGITVLAADISHVKQAELALVRERALLRALIDSIPDMIFCKNRDGTFLGCNSAWARRTGRIERDIIGLTSRDLFPRATSDLYEMQDREVLRTGKPQRTEEWVEFPNNPRMLLEVVKTPFFGPDGNILGLIGVSRDITERRHLEEQLRQAQKMEAIGQLAGGIAHDFNNLLTAILGSVSLLLASRHEDEHDQQTLREIERAAARAADLTRQLLGFSRQTMLQLEPTDLGAAVEETVSILRRTIDPRIVVEVSRAGALWPVQADPNQMNQVLVNLCLNARDAMPQGGKLTLEAANVALDEAHARKHLDARPGEFVRLRVTDTGHGIPPEIRGRIFDPFFTTKEPGKGTGLGLAMVFGILKQHQGWIECQSEVGHGTTFDIYLPRQGNAVVKPPRHPMPDSVTGGSETILLVDDEAVIRNLGRTILQRYGYKLLLAEDGQEALEVYRREMGRIDLVILDLTMPRLSGRDTLRELQKMDPNVRVLFSSGYSAEYFNDSSKDDVLGFVSKPYRPQDLALTVRRVLDQSKRPVG
jgi:two-component system, cell cycle sensor histidine kinase and response regulator CckA